MRFFCPPGRKVHFPFQLLCLMTFSSSRVVSPVSPCGLVVFIFCSIPTFPPIFPTHPGNMGGSFPFLFSRGLWGPPPDFPPPGCSCQRAAFILSRCPLPTPRLVGCSSNWMEHWDTLFNGTTPFREVSFSLLSPLRTVLRQWTSPTPP